jgi:hypothetical protein
MPVKHDMRERERDEEKSEASQKTNGSLLGQDVDGHLGVTT